MAKKFAEYKSLDLTKTNNDVLAEWMKNNVFHQSVEEREECRQFVFYEGPPSANGHPLTSNRLQKEQKLCFNYA